MAARRRRGPPSGEGATNLGHAKISTTEGYLHTLPDAGQTALAALDKIRRSTAHDDHGELQAGRNEIEELKAALVSLSLKLHRPA